VVTGTKDDTVQVSVGTNVPEVLDGSVTDTEPGPQHRDHSDLSNTGDGSISTAQHEQPTITTAITSVPKSRPSGQALAQEIDFHRISRRSLWGDDTDVFDIEHIYGPEEMREDFVNNIDSGAASEYCKICGENHIPPGPPFTLPDRDTCGSYLPEYVVCFHQGKPCNQTVTILL